MQLKRLSSQLNLTHVLLFAFFLRLVWSLLVPVETTSDSFLYDAFAKSIANGNGYAFPSGNLTVYWPVGTSAIYAVLYTLFGISTTVIVAFNLLIGTLIVWLTHELAKQYLNEKIALVAAFLVSIWPVFIQFTTILAGTLIFIFLILLILYIWGNQKIPLIIRAVFLGALICGATFVRPPALAFIVILPILELIGRKPLRESLLSFLIAVTTASLLFAPWVYRNYQVFNQFVLVSANGGANLWMGNHEGSTGEYSPLPELGFKDEVDRDKYFKKQAIEFITQNPTEYIKLAIKRAFTTYKSETIGIVWNAALEKKLNATGLFIAKFISSLYWWLMFGLAIIGVFIILRKKEMSLFNVLMVTLGYFFIFPILTVAQDRYHLPINPFLAMFAAYALYRQFNFSIDVNNKNADLKLEK
jgi:4-amino-4-deoxy-L-arabinose transferase-like glycosyltransferase